MGAPFWFDLLNKLVSIRGVGVKPEEKKPTPLTEVDRAAFQKDGSHQHTENLFKKRPQFQAGRDLRWGQ